MSTEEFSKLLKACEELERENLPIPATQCRACGEGTIYRYSNHFQCNHCRCVSTAYGGLFPRKQPDPEWSSLCQKSKERLDELLNKS